MTHPSLPAQRSVLASILRTPRLYPARLPGSWYGAASPVSHGEANHAASEMELRAATVSSNDLMMGFPSLTSGQNKERLVRCTIATKLVGRDGDSLGI